MPTRLKQPSAREYADASALREALRSFERRSDEITSSHGMTSRTYQLLLMIKTGAAGPERAGPSRARGAAEARQEHSDRARLAQREARARSAATGAGQP